MHFSTIAATLALSAAPALAHFTLTFPESRGANHETQTSSPCGGKNSVVLPRSSLDPGSVSIATTSSHAASGYEVNFCVGNDCVDADSFNYTIVDPLLINGSGNFCLPSIDFEGDFWDGDSLNGTIQVIYLSDDGELYNCADVTLTLSGDSSSSLCVNATGISTDAWLGSLAASEEAAGIETDDDSSSSSASASGHHSSTATSAAASSTASGSSNSTASSTAAASSSAVATSSAAASSSTAGAAGNALPTTGILGAVVAVLGYLAM
ncbi:hypothetical protein BZA70DRAFT_278686 [Myxozyma melibiosi]|uniref:Copper acquisition factor BIM1-like domain-containing protein n=1 Tax=Myxozyma melibiosi TaxID=54550 RepID=A0ABR1F769_9ASCO